MDPNVIFTFGIPGLVIGSWLWRRFRPAATEVTAAPITEATIAQATEEGQALPLATVLAHLNDKRDEVPHFFTIGGTGDGKSTFARLVLAPRVARGEQFIILTGKRSAVFDDLPCIGRDLTGPDGTLRYETLRQAFVALSRELARRDNIPMKQRAFTTLNILVDDATILLAELPEAAKLLRDTALLGRELDMRLIVQLGSLRVKELGWEGRGDLREHFAVVTYRKNLDGSRTTTLRPRFDSKHDIPFDASQVGVLAPRGRIDPARAWTAPRDPALELADRLGIPARKSAEIRKSDAEISEGLETDFRASESDFTISDLPFSAPEIAHIATMIALGNGKTEIVKAMPRYSGRRHPEYSAFYDQIVGVVEEALL